MRIQEAIDILESINSEGYPKTREAIKTAIEAMKMVLAEQLPLAQSAIAALNEMAEKMKKPTRYGGWLIITDVDNPLSIDWAINSLSRSIESTRRAHGPMHGLQWFIKEVDWRNVNPLEDDEDAREDELEPLTEGVCPKPTLVFLPDPPCERPAWSIGWKATFGGL